MKIEVRVVKKHEKHGIKFEVEAENKKQAIKKIKLRMGENVIKQYDFEVI